MAALPVTIGPPGRPPTQMPNTAPDNGSNWGPSRGRSLALNWSSRGASATTRHVPESAPRPRALARSTAPKQRRASAGPPPPPCHPQPPKAPPRRHQDALSPRPPRGHPPRNSLTTGPSRSTSHHPRPPRPGPSHRPSSPAGQVAFIRHWLGGSDSPGGRSHVCSVPDGPSTTPNHLTKPNKGQRFRRGSARLWGPGDGQSAFAATRRARSSASSVR